MDKNTYDLLMLAATWFSAIGTILAVIVALRLASKQRYSDIEIITHVTLLKGNSVMRVNIMNRDYRPVLVRHMSLRFFRYFGRRVNVKETLNGKWNNPEMPKKIAEQEYAIYYLSCQDLFNKSELFLMMSPRILKFLVNRLKIVVSTSTRRHSTRIPTEMKEMIYNSINSQKILNKTGQPIEITGSKS